MIYKLSLPSEGGVDVESTALQRNLSGQLNKSQMIKSQQSSEIVPFTLGTYNFSDDDLLLANEKIFMMHDSEWEALSDLNFSSSGIHQFKNLIVPIQYQMQMQFSRGKIFAEFFYFRVEHKRSEKFPFFVQLQFE